MNKRTFPPFALEDLPAVWYAVQNIADTLGFDKIDPARPDKFLELRVTRQNDGKYGVAFKVSD